MTHQAGEEPERWFQPKDLFFLHSRKSLVTETEEGQGKEQAAIEPCRSLC